MSKRNIIVIILLLIVVVTVAIVFTGKKGQIYTTADVVRGNVLQTVSATGTVEAAKKLDLEFVNSGKIAEIDVKVGDTVKEGAVLAKLDTKQIESQFKKTQASLDAAKANLDKLMQGATLEDIKVSQTAVDNAKIALNSANSSLSDAKASAEKDVASSQASVDSAQVALDNAINSMNNTKITNENNLNKQYNNAWDTANPSLLTASNSINTNQYTLDFEDAKDTLSVLNPQYLYDSVQSKSIAVNSYNVAKSHIDSIKPDPAHNDIDATLNKIKSALEDIRKALSDTDNVLQATVTSSKLSLAELDTLKANISTARTNVNTAISNITTAAQNISTQKITNQTNLDSAQATVNSAQSSLGVASNSLAATKVSAAAKINASENAVKVAEGALKQAQDALALKKAKPRVADVALLQSQVKEAKASLDSIQNQLNDSVLIAPRDGIVTEVNGDIDEIATPAKTFISLITSDNFEIKANVSEVDIAKIKTGNEVDITFDAFGSDKRFTGKVVKIDPAETEVSGVIYYNVTTIFTEDSAIIKPGMTANLDIMTAKKENVATIPFQALKEKDGKKYVQVLKNGTLQDTYVEIGLKGDVNVEITSGLNGGEKVVTFAQ